MRILKLLNKVLSFQKNIAHVNNDLKALQTFIKGLPDREKRYAQPWIDHAVEELETMKSVLKEIERI